jgi:methylated-DNA-[protein]-cysteine S-methyltransferase
MVKEYKGYIESEIGFIEVVGTERGILSVGFVERRSVGSRSLHPRVQACVKQLEQYFGGKRKAFSMELVLEGTHFQKKVWEQLMKIPFGIAITSISK